MLTSITRTIGKPEITYLGLSTDIKPTKDVDNGDTFLELNTGKTFIYSKVNINPVTSNGWWEV